MSDDSREVRLEVWINALPETVYALLTEPSHMTSWLAEVVEADSRPGGVFRISGPANVSIVGKYIEAIPYQKVMFTWGGVEGLKPGQSIVEFLLEPERGGTLVRLRHYGLPDSAIESHRLGWVHSGLVKIKDAAEGRMPTRLCLNDLAEQRGAL